MSLCSEFHVVMSIKISTLKLCPFRPYLQLFVGGYMLYVRYLCLFVYSGVQQILHCALFFFVFVLCMAVSNTYHVVFLFCFPSSRVPYVASFSGLSFFDCPFSILQRLFRVFSLTNNLPMSPHSRSKEWHVLLKYNNRS